ncbi:MAG TPA: rhomboid family intramembrane serine protease [Firmicutes bacterium]|jgi:membrane associated rhomboid family serine protease|nr:rhomboid family intramembrane serine protease [Bacillota bacterium]HHT42775.1 rhomboid family intramembrane serine protease [Bacillota bacterium]
MKAKYLGNSPAAWALLLVNIVVFAALRIFPSLTDAFLLEPSLALERPWTLLTVCFSHELLIHMLLNMFLVLIFGARLEKETNAGVMLTVCVVCGFIGSLGTIAYAAAIGYQGAPIAGASASAFGLAAAYAALRPKAVVLKSKAVHWVAALFVVNALLTVQNPQVSIGGPAHAVGIVIGLIVGYLLRKEYGTIQA